MTHGDDGVATIEVKVFSALFVPHTAALCLDGSHIEKGIDIEKFQNE